jgi:soluble lytic murein transglycosylase-like protein
MHRLHCFPVALLAVAVVAPAFAQAPVPKPIDVALTEPAGLIIPRLGTVEGVLSAADVERYRLIFEYQDDGHWKQADALIGQLTDFRLLGHVKAQRYLHPTKYRSRYSELSDWMARFADHPQAARIHALAVKRQPKGAAGPQPPTRYRSVTLTVYDEDLPRTETRRASAKSHALYNRIRKRAQRGWPTGALEILDAPETQRDLAGWQADEARREITRAYYHAGKNDEALAIAETAMAGSGEAPLVFWWGGLAAWRLGRIDDAQRMFTTLAQSDTDSGWSVSAGAFWASRAYLVGGRPERVNEMLAVAARHPLTFYGLLARRALGLDSSVAWAEPALASVDVAAIAETPRGARALALLQVGRAAAAEPELYNLVAVEPALGSAVLALAVRAELPALSLRLSGHGNARELATAAFPLPDWQPDEGFAIDRALVFAFIRQESAFNARAKSHAGARGLMQLMPRTASYIGRQTTLHGRGKHKLFDPGLNMALGQRYIAYLLEDEAIGNDLFRLAAAYNAGPGNLRSWQRSVDYRDDPLLFIESLPSRETRLFIERILTNFWIYRDRLGQPAPSLENVVTGTWPGYVPLDGTAQEQTAYAGN